MTRLGPRSALVAWLTLAGLTLVVTSIAGAVVHLAGVAGRLGPLVGLWHALEYAFLPGAGLVLRLLAAVVVIGLPLHLLVRRRVVGVVLPAAVVAAVTFLTLSYLDSVHEADALLHGSLDVLWPPVLGRNPVLTGLVGVAAGAAAGLWLAAGAAWVLERRLMRRGLIALAAVYLAVLASALAAPYLVPPPVPSARPNVLLVSMDTLRADHLGLYGYERDTSPSIDRLGRSGTVFEHVVSQAPWTLPAHMSLFTGLYPSQHGLTEYTLDRDRWSALSPGAPMLAQILQDQGYVTAAFTGGGFVDPAFGFARGFDMYRTESQRLEGFHGSVKRWLRRHRRTPFFLFLQFYNCHRPYRPPPGYASVFAAGGRVGTGSVVGFCREAELSGTIPPPETLAAVVDHYDGEIRFADELLGDLFSFLHLLELERRTLIVFLSDHGEEMFEHGNCDHIKSLYEPALRVPLILSGPGIAPGRRIREVVELREVGRLILDYLGIPGGLGASASRPWQLLAGRHPEDAPGLAFAETCCQGYEVRDGRWSHQPWDGGIRSLQSRRFKLVTDEAGGPLELYDLLGDPGETVELLGNGTAFDDPDAATALSELRAEIGARLRTLEGDRWPTVDHGSVDEATELRLRALGYAERGAAR